METPVQVDYRIAEKWLLTIAKRNYAGSTVQTYMSVARSFWKWMAKYDKVEANPFRELEPVKYKAPLPKPLPENEVRALIQNEPEPFWRTMWHFFYATGARIAEVVSLRRKDIDLEGKQVRILGKGKKERLVPLSDKIVDVLRLHLSTIPEDYNCIVFRGKRGLKVSKETVRKRVKEAADRAAISSNVHPHRFRHSIATHLLEHGGDIRYIQEFLGHDLLSTTQKYTKVAQVQLVKMVAIHHPDNAPGAKS